MLVTAQHAVGVAHDHVGRMRNWNVRLHGIYMCGINGVDVGCDVGIDAHASRCSSASEVVASRDVLFIGCWLQWSSRTDVRFVVCWQRGTLQMAWCEMLVFDGETYQIA